HSAPCGRFPGEEGSASAPTPSAIPEGPDPRVRRSIRAAPAGRETKSQPVLPTRRNWYVGTTVAQLPLPPRPGPSRRPPPGSRRERPRPGPRASRSIRRQPRPHTPRHTPDLRLAGGPVREPCDPEIATGRTVRPAAHSTHDRSWRAPAREAIPRRLPILTANHLKFTRRRGISPVVPRSVDVHRMR